MSDDDYFPMPKSDRDAFRFAVLKLHEWRHGEPEPEVSLEGKQYPISAIFGFADKFVQDKMPDDVLLLARGIFDETGAAEKSEIDSNPSYGNAAKILARRVRERHAEFKRREDQRR
jgi:hypothetical protein